MNVNMYVCMHNLVSMYYARLYFALYVYFRSTDYGKTFNNETGKFPSDAVAHWYHISKDSNKVKLVYKTDCL